MINRISFITDIVTCVGVIVAVFSFLLTLKNVLSEYERNKKLSTMQILREYMPQFHKYNRIIFDTYKNEKVDYAELIKKKKIERIIWKYFSDLEFICTGINIGIYDIYTMERIYGDVIVKIFYQFLDYIRERRKQRNSNIVYAELELVVKEIEKMQHKNKNLLNGEADIKYAILKS